MKVEALRQWRRIEQRRRFLIAEMLSAFLLLLAIVGGVLWSRSGQLDRGYRTRSTVSAPIAPGVRVQLPPPDLYRPIAPEEAQKLNAERAFSGRADTPASAFKISGDKASTDRALECLTQAVYYEAASEGSDGQKAVAQIVLNRMRHPAYPASVCGVVYQGSERSTGCQFTFTCDGSLARAPTQSLWKQARRVATEALSGKVFAPVGHATHYHADYVSPYWADSLDKSVQIGRHIFYRLKGGLGARQTFNQRYAGNEPLPPAPSSVEVSLEGIESADSRLPSIPNSGLKVEVGELVQSKDPPPQIAADSAAGKLLLDGDAAPVKAPSAGLKVQADACPGVSTSGRLKPMRAADQRAQAQSGC